MLFFYNNIIWVIYLNIKLIKKLQIASIIFSILLGTLLHFTFELSSNNLFIASFSAVNESVWEHLKLVFFPMLIFSIIEYFLLKNYNNKNNYIFSKTVSIIFAILFITIFFYTYTGIIGKCYFILDILSFLLAIILGELICYKLLIKNTKINNSIKYLCIFFIIILLLFFVFFTYFPPKINYFKDPVNKSYGINLK